MTTSLYIRELQSKKYGIMTKQYTEIYLKRLRGCEFDEGEFKEEGRLTKWFVGHRNKNKCPEDSETGQDRYDPLHFMSSNEGTKRYLQENGSTLLTLLLTATVVR